MAGMSQSDTSAESVEPIPLISIHHCFLELQDEAKGLYLDVKVRECKEAPSSALDFHRDWVSKNLPVIFRGGANHWPAIEKWTNEYLGEKMADHPLTVSVTPNGYADAVTHDMRFVMPHEDQMTMSEFVKIIEEPKSRSGIHYVQKQNSNLTDEMSQLLEDVSEMKWASEAFGKKPDAINFWMGDERAVTSTHKDHYENIYCVVRGHKDFMLFPPTDLASLPYVDCRPAKYVRAEDGTFSIKNVPNAPRVPWIVIDPLKPDLVEYPDYQDASPVMCRVNAGDVLYLPSLWFHHIQQSHGCVAVNYWYDMEFDVKYNYFNFMKNLLYVSREYDEC